MDVFSSSFCKFQTQTWQGMNTKKSQALTKVRNKASCLIFFLAGWTALLKLAINFVPLSPENTTRAATEKLQSNWNKEKTKCRENGKKPRLWKSVLRMLSVKDIIIFSLSGAMYSVSKISLILLITYLISALLSSQAQNNLAYLSALAMFITSLFQAMGHHHVCYRGELTGIRVSCALKGLIYHKVSK